MVNIILYILIGLLSGTIGGLIGAKIAIGLSSEILRKLFGFALFLVSLHMIFTK